MAIFRTFTADGRVQLDSDLVKYHLVKSCYLSYGGYSSSRPDDVLYDVVRGDFNHLYYVDIASDNCPICFIHYDGDIYDKYGVERGLLNYNFIYPLKVIKTGDRKYRFYFGSMVDYRGGEIYKYQLYFFDAVVAKEDRVGLNLYDKTGRLTFSTKHAPLQVVYQFTAHKNADSYGYYDYAIANNAGGEADERENLFNDVNLAYRHQASSAGLAVEFALGKLDAYLNTGQVDNDEFRLIIDQTYHPKKFKAYNPKAYTWGRHPTRHTPDYAIKPLKNNRKYATHCQPEGALGYMRFSGVDSGAYTTTFSSFGIKGAVMACAVIMNTPLHYYGTDKGVGSRWYWQESYREMPRLPSILVADITNLPFPYN